MSARSTNGRFESTRNDINNERAAASTETPDISAMLDGLNASASAAAIKFAIGFAYAWVGFIASWNIAIMCALVTSIVFLQYIIAAAVFAACLAGLVAFVPTASDLTYTAGAYVAEAAGKAYASVCGWFSKEPAPSTVH